MAALASAAHGQEAASLTLLCTGTDATVVAMTPYVWTGRAYYGGVGYGEGRAAAQLGVAVDGGKVRVRPPKSSVPLFSKESKDGWYELTDVTVDRLQIRGRMKWNRIDRAKLAIDRRTGAATFGAFSGACSSVPNSPDATKF
ncbi:hypothetical protein [Phenylobacterium sp.]|uniref:hypothetical protein n=1 Tax=Phenylobacterium sp. TaxID=1871053 RepID=UPI002EDB8763